jgi:predicted glycoside hydrolase/deacetylase ChbG (UPF0249 family)
MKVILNADDFGSTERHTRLIVDLLARGKISSTTFLVNLPYATTAAAQLRSLHPHLVGQIGLHFNLTEGSPLNADLLQTPFVNAQQQLQDFRGRVSAWQQLRHLGKLREELDLQIVRFEAMLGCYPTHIDSHGHTHCTWIMLLALLTSKQAGHIKRIRLTRQYDHEPAQLAGLKNQLRRLAKKMLNAAFRLRFKTVDYFTDIRNMDGSWLGKAQLDVMQGKFQTVEIMCHPYYFDESEYEFLSASPNAFDQMPHLKIIPYTAI